MKTACIFGVFLEQVNVNDWATTYHKLELISCDAVEVCFGHHLLQTFLDAIDLKNCFINAFSLYLSDVFFSFFVCNFDVLAIMDNFMLLSVTGVVSPSDWF